MILCYFFFLQVWQYLIPAFKITGSLDCVNTGCCPTMTPFLTSPEERRCIRRQGRNVTFNESCKRIKLLCLLCLLSKNHRMELYWKENKGSVLMFWVSRFQMYTYFYICCTDLYTRWRLTVFCFPFATTSSELRALGFLILFQNNLFLEGGVI